MRDPRRIDHVLEVVREAWEKYPDLRLSQLIINVADYYTEDEKLVANIDKAYLGEYNGRHRKGRNSRL